MSKNAQYLCEMCNFKTRNKTDYSRHIGTPKHVANAKMRKKDIEKTHPHDNAENICQCGKIYKHHSGLWRHKKVCCVVNHCDSNEKLEDKNTSTHPYDSLTNNITEKDLILYLIKENQEFKELIMEQSNKMLELASKPSTINNTNCNNKHQFNLQVFLNEKCKNAMNISEFVSSLEIESNDFEDMGKLGYVQGISNIFIKGLKDLDETVRPLHCSDKKRETLYIKDNDVWDRDDTKDKIRNAISLVAHKNFKFIPIWRDANPSSVDVTSKKNSEYMRIVNQVTTCITPDDEAGINRIIRNVANTVTIDRSAEA